jgi:hypothetical protein
VSGKLKNLIAGENSKTLRQRINKCVKAGYTYRFSRSWEDFDLFYHRLYRPFVLSRHGVRALVTPCDFQWNLWIKSAGGGLVFVTHDERVIAGTICVVADGVCYDMEMGVLDGDPAIFQAGINTFLLWCGLKWAKEQGAQYYNMGPTPGWQFRSSFDWKAKWRARVVREEGISRQWRFYAQSVSASLAKRICEIGFICEKRSGFYSIVLEQSAGSVTKVDLAQRVDFAKKKGLDGVCVVAPNAQSKFLDY